MSRALTAGVACAWAFGLTAVGGDAWASGPAFALEYEAPTTCPSAVSINAEARARIADRPVAASDERRFRVRIVEDGRGYRGALETLDPPSVREVVGETCDEVARALVVFLALAVSPGHSDDTPSRPPPRDDTKPPPVEPTPSRSARDAPVKPEPLRSGLGVDLRGLAAAGVTPGPAFGGGVAARLVLQTRPWLRWIVHVGGLLAYRDEPVLDGAFSFRWSAARVDAGPSLDVGTFRVSGGPTVRAGVLSVQARDLLAAREYSSFWGDVAAFARLDRALSPSIALSLMIELGAPLRRRTFGIEGIAEPVHEVPPIVGIVSLGVTMGR